ncbi:MAG: hypothetical protein ABIL58_23420 [Pseudomonadota bacterium]
MGKNPADQFYWQDWARDLEEHPLEVEGAWIRLCCKLWFSDTRGEASKTLDQWARILRVDTQKAAELIGYIGREKIGNVSISGKPNSCTNSSDLTEPNTRITVVSRRMQREEKERENNRIRQRRHYDKRKPNGEPNAPLTPPSSSSPSDKQLSIDSCSSESPPADSAPAPKIPACPHNEIIALYNRICIPAGCPEIREWDETAKGYLRARWREKPERQSLGWWETFIQTEVAASDYLTGKVKPWSADLRWIVKPSNFAKILNGNYRNRGRVVPMNSLTTAKQLREQAAIDAFMAEEA